MITREVHEDIEAAIERARLKAAWNDPEGKMLSVFSEVNEKTKIILEEVCGKSNVKVEEFIDWRENKPLLRSARITELIELRTKKLAYKDMCSIVEQQIENLIDDIHYDPEICATYKVDDHIMAYLGLDLSIQITV